MVCVTRNDHRYIRLSIALHHLVFITAILFFCLGIAGASRQSPLFAHVVQNDAIWLVIGWSCVFLGSCGLLWQLVLFARQKKQGDEGTRPVGISICLLSCLFAAILFLGLGGLNVLFYENAYVEMAGPLWDMAQKKEEVVLVGQVIRMPVSSDRGDTRLRIGLLAKAEPHGLFTLRGDILLLVKGLDYRDVLPGDLLRFAVRLREPRGFAVPGAFDHRLWLEIQGIHATASVVSPLKIAITGHISDSPVLPHWRYVLETARTRLVRALCAAFPSNDTRSLAVGLLLGDQGGMDKDVLELAQLTGISHLLAVSGTNMTLVALICGLLVYRLLINWQSIALRFSVRRIAAGMAVLAVFVYAGMAGFSVSAMRAVLMTAAVSAAFVLNRPQSLLNALALAGLVLLMFEPLQLFSPSFQLSFAAVFFLCGLATPFLQRFEKTTDSGMDMAALVTLKQRLVSLFVAGFVALLATTPFIAWHFQRFSLLALPVNLIAVPLTDLILLPGLMLGALSLPFSSTVAFGIWGVMDVILGLSLNGLRWIGDWEYASFWCVKPWMWQVVLSYLALLALVLAVWHRDWRKRWIVASFVCVMICFGGFGYRAWAISHNTTLRLHVLDVGQGLAQVVEGPGGFLMVMDAGGLAGSHDFDTGERLVAPFIRYLGYNKIDLLVMSHPEHDHMGGIPYLLQHFRVRHFWANGDEGEGETWSRLQTALDHIGLKVEIPKDGDSLNIRGLFIRPLLLQGCSGLETRNARSLVLMLGYRGRSLLLTGDMNAQREACIADALSPMDVLVAPHHGSKSSSSQVFVQKSRPGVVIVSVGRDNPFHLPNQTVLGRYLEIGSRILRTDLNGTITVEVSASGALGITNSLP